VHAQSLERWGREERGFAGGMARKSGPPAPLPIHSCPRSQQRAAAHPTHPHASPARPGPTLAEWMYFRPRSIWYRKNWWCSGVRSSLALMTCR
jgi:hypothetical protein